MSLRKQPFSFRPRVQRNPAGRCLRVGVEVLESRQLLSVTLGTAHRNLIATPAATSASVAGYSPAQIRHAYGFDQVSGTGAGQTIAIVDAFNDPNIVGDLHTFDQQFGIADPPSLKVVSQTGGSVSSVRNDSGWSSEIALDVEWAHAIAPQAKILLVEARSANFTDLIAGVDYARHAAGVSVVSMSWGSGEFWGQTQYDKYFTTPAGHNGVTFVASSGDSGSWGGPEWPSSSPNVLSVGGTTLRTGDTTGSYGTEAGWSDSGGGISALEREPAYQLGAQSSRGRSSPDVSYNANPNTGFAVYSSVPDGGYIGWSEYGGTSAGAPQWAALVAIADQARGSQGSLDGATGTLPMLYKLYSAPGSASYSTYTANFNDIASGSSSYFMSAHSGYDGVTGLGSPKVARIISALGGISSPTTTVTKVTTPAAQTFRTRLFSSSLIARPAAAPTQTVLPLHALIEAASASSARDLVESSSSLRLTGSILASQATFHVTQILSSAPASFWQATFPAPGRGAAETVAQAVAGTIGVGETTVQAIEGTAATVIDMGRPDALAAFADAVAGFAHESASLGTILGDAGTHTGAWAATFAVLGIDAVLIGYWRSTRKSKRGGRDAKGAISTFSLQPV